VKTTGGELAGTTVTDAVTGRSVRRYAGIPYAAPPVGARRFQAPGPAPSWDGVRPADAFGPSAPQRTTGPLTDAVPGMRATATDEDCLTLNVWTPEGAAPGAGLPVLVWIHGGAYVIGGSALETYDGTHLSAMHDAVLVSVNYRLGALGFLVLPEGAAAELGASPNNGLLDQLAALQWVGDNIAAFGGDPSTTTLFGESAGAGCILHQLGVPAGDGLYRRAILQSPGAETIDRPLAEQLSGAFMRRAGVDPARPEALLELTTDAILDAQEGAAEDLAHAFGAMPWAPVIDGEVLPLDPRRRIAAGGTRDLDVIVGTTSGELGLYTGAMAELPPEAIAGVLRHLLTPVLGRDPGVDACARLVAAYQGDGTRAAVEVYTDVLSDAAMAVPALQLADALAASGTHTFSYRFDWPAPVMGPCHASDLPFTFGTLDVEGWSDFVGADADAHRLADDIGAAWVAFARTGDPSNDRVGSWPAYDDERQVMMLGRACSVVEHPVAARLHLHAEVLDHPSEGATA
jgi:para-nitrobenzyl esterase